MVGDAVGRVRAALEAKGCKVEGRNGHDFMAECPVHEDGTASLSVGQGKIGAMLFCHACGKEATPQIVAALGLTMADLRDDATGEGSQPRASVAVHPQGYRIGTALPAAPKEPDPFKPTKMTPDTSAWTGGETVAISPVGARGAVCSYPYAREDGTVCMRIARVPEPDGGKCMVCCHRDGRESGGANGRVEASARELVYRLPELRAAIDGGAESVYIAEGEKDVDMLRAFGLPATCNPNGAGKWRHAHSAHLRGARRVGIFMDNDRPGRAHAEAVRASLALVCPGLDVRCIEVPSELGAFGVRDVTDYVFALRAAEGASATRRTIRAALDTLIGNAFAATPAADPATPANAAKEPAPSRSLVCLADVERESVEWLAYPYLPVGKLVLLDGDPGVGKSQLTMAVAAAVTTGASLLGGSARTPGDVLFVAMEDGPADTLRPRADAAGADPSRIMLHLGWGETRAPLQLPRDASKLRAILEEYPAQHDGRRVTVLVVDPIMSHVEERQGHPDVRTREALGPLVTIAQDFDLTVIAVRHFVKRTKGTAAMHGGSGSVAFAGLARVVLQLGKDPADPSRRILAVAKSNLGPIPPSLALRIEDAGGVPNVVWDGTSPLTAEDLLLAREDTGDADEQDARKEAADWVVEFLQAQPGHSFERAKLLDAGETEGHARRTTERALSRHTREGRIAKSRRLGFGKGVTYTLAPRAESHSPVTSCSPAIPANSSDPGETGGETGPADLFGHDSVAISSAHSLTCDGTGGTGTIGGTDGLSLIDVWGSDDDIAGAA